MSAQYEQLWQEYLKACQPADERFNAILKAAILQRAQDNEPFLAILREKREAIHKTKPCPLCKGENQ